MKTGLWGIYVIDLIMFGGGLWKYWVKKKCSSHFKEQLRKLGTEAESNADDGGVTQEVLKENKDYQSCMYDIMS